MPLRVEQKKVTYYTCWSIAKSGIIAETGEIAYERKKYEKDRRFHFYFN